MHHIFSNLTCSVYFGLFLSVLVNFILHKALKQWFTMFLGCEPFKHLITQSALFIYFIFTVLGNLNPNSKTFANIINQYFMLYIENLSNV